MIMFSTGGKKNRGWTGIKGGIADIYGAFHDVASARRELEIGAEIDDADVARMVDEDLGQRAMEADRKYQAAEQKARDADNRIQEANRRAQEAEQKARNEEQSRIARQQELETERIRRRAYENVLDPFGNAVTIASVYGRPYDPLSTVKYLEKERLKKEVKDELANERKWKAASRTPRSKSRSKRQTSTKSKSRQKSKSKTKKKSKK